MWVGFLLEAWEVGSLSTLAAWVWTRVLPPRLAGVGGTLGIVVSWGCCGTVPHRKWLTQQHVLTPAPGGWKPEIEGPAGGLPSLSPRVWMAVLSLCPSVRVCVLIPSSGKDPGHAGSGTPR